MLYKEQEKRNEAKLLLPRAAEDRHYKLGDEHPHTIESLNDLIDLNEAWNKPEKAKEWRTKLIQKEAVEE